MTQIDLSNSRLIVLTYPDLHIDLRTIHWFDDRGLSVHNIVASNNRCSIVEARNRIFRDLVLPNLSNTDWFIFMDRDQYPTKNSDPFLEDNGDPVVGATYNAGNPGAWIHPNQFHMGCVRMHSSVLSDLIRPIFKFKYEPDYTEIKSCECEVLRQQFISKDVRISRLGHVGHDSQNSWFGPSVCRMEQ